MDLYTLINDDVMVRVWRQQSVRHDHDSLILNRGNLSPKADGAKQIGRKDAVVSGLFQKLHFIFKRQSRCKEEQNK